MQNTVFNELITVELQDKNCKLRERAAQRQHKRNIIKYAHEYLSLRALYPVLFSTKGLPLLWIGESVTTVSEKNIFRCLGSTKSIKSFLLIDARTNAQV